MLSTVSGCTSMCVADTIIVVPAGKLPASSTGTSTSSPSLPQVKHSVVSVHTEAHSQQAYTRASADSDLYRIGLRRSVGFRLRFIGLRLLCGLERGAENSVVDGESFHLFAEIVDDVLKVEVDVAHRV